jgi:hypothetical protein
MGTAVRTATTSPASWDAFADVDAFVDEVLVELAALEGTKPTRSGPKPALTGAALGDLSYRGQRLSKAGEALGITLQPSAGGHGGSFIPDGIRWVVEHSVAWISRYRRLNTIFERTEGHLVAFIEIAFVSILSRRLIRLVPQEISA